MPPACAYCRVELPAAAKFCAACGLSVSVRVVATDPPAPKSRLLSLGEIQKSLIIAVVMLTLTYYGLIERAPAPPLAELTVSPAQVAGGGSAEGRITLNAPAPAGGLLVALESGLATVRVPATVMVPEGRTTAAFSIQTWAVVREKAVAITAGLRGTRKTTTLTVAPGRVHPPAEHRDHPRVNGAP